MTRKNSECKPTIDKARVWVGILYPENMQEGWQDEIVDAIPLPLAYCIHDKDTRGHAGDRKIHVHCMVCFPNTTTWKHAVNVFNVLSKEGVRCCSTAEACISARRTYEYLIHNTQNARKKKKHLYDESERIELNGFDIGSIEQVSLQRKNEMCKELCDFTIQGGFKNMRELYVKFGQVFTDDYFEIFKANNALLARLVKGNYQSDQLLKEELEKPGIKDFKMIKKETTVAEIFYCENCGERFSVPIGVDFSDIWCPKCHLRVVTDDVKDIEDNDITYPDSIKNQFVDDGLLDFEDLY